MKLTCSKINSQVNGKKTLMIKPATATCSRRKLTKDIETDEEEDETDLAFSMSTTDESDSESEEYGKKRKKTVQLVQLMCFTVSSMEGFKPTSYRSQQGRIETL